MEAFLNQLNESQRAAVTYTDGPLLVIAGAGSGKTRVLTYKIAYLIHQDFAPQQILALTFTNKAAREMKERIATVTGEETARRLWMGTFHSIFSRILRYESASIGYPHDFTIYDSSDSQSLLKTIMKEMALDDKTYRPQMVQSRISNAKNSLVTWTAYEKDRELMENDFKAKVPLICEIYKRYQNRCFQAGAMDFDDLLLQTNILFRDHPEVLDKYRRIFRYVLVDEYQDTNYAQHLIVQRLCEEHKQICVVGDDAQSIYSFRGANIDNILKFKNIYPDCRVFKLERNYRSTQTIVNAANSLIHKNTEQIHKTVYSEKESGERIAVYTACSDYEEGYIVTARIEEMRKKDRTTYAGFAILYRTNVQSRVLEEALRKRGIPYKIYGGLSFYQRKEIRDMIGYFRLIVNPNDEEAFKRVINYPKRGIGDTTVGKLLDAASQQAVSLWTVVSAPLEYGVSLQSGTVKKLADFCAWIQSLAEESRTHTAEEMAAFVVNQSGIRRELAEDTSVEGMSRKENMDELLKGIAEFCQIRQEEDNERVSLSDFLSEVSLFTDMDNDKEENADRVTLMTVHAAKGLEFPNVFVVGLEENLFPSPMVKDNPKGLEEERRLFYVAITRAERRCVLTYAKSRFRNGQTEMCSPSRFLKDIDPLYLNLPDELAGYRKQEMRTERQPVAPAPVAPSRLKRLVPEKNKEQASQMPIETGGLQIGHKVLHDRFGEGVVTAFEESGPNTKAVVDFVHSGQKKLLLKFAKLTLLEEAGEAWE